MRSRALFVIERFTNSPNMVSRSNHWSNVALSRCIYRDFQIRARSRSYKSLIGDSHRMASSVPIGNGTLACEQRRGRLHLHIDDQRTKTTTAPGAGATGRFMPIYAVSPDLSPSKSESAHHSGRHWEEYLLAIHHRNQLLV